MKKNLLLAFLAMNLMVSGFAQSPKQEKAVKTPKSEKNHKVASNSNKPSRATIKLRKKHAQFLAATPFAKTNDLSKKERKALGIPPNKYYEMEWENTMDPVTGRPTPENLIVLREELKNDRAIALAAGRTPGDASDNNWVERGPTNVGGRTRAIMFDPNDATYQTVFAGGVSGGLWKNTNISDANTSWTRVNIPENLAVSVITYDPNNTNIFYAGTGESYVGGDVNGDGVWKSTDGGTTWNKVFGGISGPTVFQSASNVTVNSPAGIAGNYASYPTTAFGGTILSPITADIVLVNDGTATPTWGCSALTNGSAVAGKIALIRRGSCTFVEKVLNAQNAGAIAVIMMNNIDGQPIPMGGSDPSITIPSVMISKADGDILEAALGSGPVNATLNPTMSGVITGNLVPGIQHINDIKVRNNGGVSEVYVAAGDTYYAPANSATYMGASTYGLYKSIDGGANWNEVNMPLTSGGYKYCPNDIAIAADNKVWVSTLRSVAFGEGGGTIFSSADGTNFALSYTVSGADRTQIAASTTTADKLYVLAELAAGGVTMLRTTNGFANTATMALPDDADTGIPANDFCRQQAFYNLLLEVDPVNDQILYAGGIDLFRSTNGGTSWAQISKWSNNNNLSSLSCSLVHADQHAITFKPGDSNIALLGNDGGIYYASSLSAAGSSATISSRNKGFNVTQFYSLGVAATNAVSGLTGDYFAAGSQDNGTQYFAGVGAGQQASVQSQGGDGASTMFDQGADKYYISNYVYNQSINLRFTAGTTRSINSESSINGAFITPMVLDSNLDILYADYSNSTPTYQIRRYKNLKTGLVNKVVLTNALLTSPPTAFAVSKYTTASTTLLVGTRLGRLLKLTNADTTPVWTDITGPAFVGSISDVEYGMSENEIFVTFHNYNVTSIWYSADGGATWSNKEGNFPDIPVKCILQNPLNTNEVIIGTELGVWFTNTFNTASPTWNQSYNGMSNVKVTDLDLRNDNTVFASTYGRGIFSGIFTATTLSSDSFTLNNSIKIYPNPTSEVLNVAIPNYSGAVTITLYDVNGRQVVSQNQNDFNVSATLNVNQLAKGVYVVQVKGKELDYSSKVVVE